MKPILFSTKMISAIIDGKKTVTRRVIKPANPRIAKPENWKQNTFGLWVDMDTENGDKCSHIKDYSVGPLWWTLPSYMKKYAPYKTGDVLYVREKFCKGSIAYGEESDGRCVPYVSQCIGENNHIPYEYCIRNNIGIEDVVWEPSLHMKKKDARIFLRVTDVRVQKLSDMTIQDVHQEGCSIENGFKEFQKIWDSTLSKDNYPYYCWEKSPYVWVIYFDVIKKDAI